MKPQFLFTYLGAGAEEILARQEAMELARRKMQEQYDKRAQEFAIKQKQVMLASFNCLFLVFQLCCDFHRKRKSCAKKN